MEALKWAMTKLNSTAKVKEDSIRGLGLFMLLSFARLNNATIRICTGNVLYTYNNKKFKFEELKNKFLGTLFEMEIVTDNDHIYILD